MQKQWQTSFILSVTIQKNFQSNHSNVLDYTEETRDGHWNKERDKMALLRKEAKKDGDENSFSASLGILSDGKLSFVSPIIFDEVETKSFYEKELIEFASNFIFSLQKFSRIAIISSTTSNI